MQDEYYALAKSLRTAVADALTGTRGSAAGEAAVLGVMVWLLTVLWMRQRPKVYLVDFKTYRHATVGGDPKNTAGEAVGYDKFLDVSRIARHTDGANCFTERSMEFQEKIIRTSCIGEKRQNRNKRCATLRGWIDYLRAASRKASCMSTPSTTPPE